MVAEIPEIRIVLNPVSYGNTCFKRALQFIESAVAFAEQRKIARGIVQD